MRRVEDATAALAASFVLGDVTERGTLSSVRDVRERATNRSFSLRTIHVAKYQQATACTKQQVEEALSLPCTLRHPFIEECSLIFLDDSFAHLIREKLLAQDICFEIVARSSNGFVYSEAVASYYAKQLLEAIKFLHEQGIVHRDIRPHNIILASQDNSAPLKLCGFDVAMRIDALDATFSAGRAGVAHFMSPEMASGGAYGPPSDCWSVGVVLHLLLSGRLPIDGAADHVISVLEQQQFALSRTSWPSGMSDGSLSLVQQLLSPSASLRLSASNALSHPWISQRDSNASRSHLQLTVSGIARYNERRRLKSRITSCAASSSLDSSLRKPTIASPDAGDCCLPLPEGAAWTTSADAATTLILRSVDEMAAICDPSAFFSSSSPQQDARLKGLLLLYEKISSLEAVPACAGVEASSVVRSIRESLAELASPTEETAELTRLLESPLLLAALQAHDVIVQEVMPGKWSEQSSSSTAPGEAEAAGDGIFPSSSGAAPNEHAIPTPHPALPQNSQGSAPFSYLNGSVLPGVGVSATTSDAVTTDEDDLLESVSRIRLVQFQKDTQEPMGITLKVTEDGQCFVARIMHGGLIHRQATLHVGDEIREINGVSVTNRSVDSLQRLLRDARGQVTFKIVPSYRSAPPACEIFVRAQFDYDPADDDLIPCAQAGIPFKTGDILQVISKDDHNWWQARFVASFPSFGPQTNTGPVVAGLIPSPELQEWRTACLAMERAKDSSHCMWFGKKKKYYPTKYLQKHSALFDQLDLVTYEEVMRLAQFRRKTLVLLGAHGVGRRHIKNTLIHRHPTRFAYPIPHTTRPPRKDEIDGKHYFFVSNDEMLAEIEKNEYLEYGTHEENMYGTKLDTIRAIHRAGKIAILDVEPQALKVLRTAEYSPFVVFIAAPNLHGLHDPDGSLERLLRESEVLRQAFGHLFDYVLVNNDIDDTISQIERVAEKLTTSPQWLPVSWVY